MTEAAGEAAGEELRLEAVEGRAAGFMLVVDERLVFGRQSEGPGKLADDPELSRHHAEIELTPNGQFTLKDLSSTNGTFLNGTRLKAAVILSVGDQIEVGGTKLVVRSAPAATPPGQAPQAPVPDVDVRAATVTVDVPPAMREATPPEPPEPPVPPAADAAPGDGPERAPETAPETEPDTKPQPVASEPPLLVSLTVDFEHEAAELAVQGSGEPIRLALDHGQWRIADGGA